MSNKIAVTKEGLEELKKEYHYLVHTMRDEVKEELKEARSHGDLSENSDLDAARDRQARMESRIREVAAMIENAEIITDSKSHKRVALGSKVTLLELDSNNTCVYQIVGSIEGDPLNGKLSNESPLARAIIDHKVNDVCLVRVDDPYKVKILDLE